MGRAHGTNLASLELEGWQNCYQASRDLTFEVFAMTRSDKPTSKPDDAHQPLTADRRKKPQTETPAGIKAEETEDHLEQREELSKDIKA